MQYLEELHWDEIGAGGKWTLRHPTCTHQKDTDSCGVLVMENASRILRDQPVEDTDVSPTGIRVMRHRIASELVAGVLNAFELVPTTASHLVESTARTIECPPSSSATVVSAPVPVTGRTDLVRSDPGAKMTGFELVPTTPSQRVESMAGTTELPPPSPAMAATPTSAPVPATACTDHIRSNPAAKMKVMMPVTPRRTLRFTYPLIGDVVATTKRPLVAAVPSILHVNDGPEGGYPLIQIAEFILGKGYEGRLRAGETISFQVFPSGLDRHTIDLLVAEVEMYIDRSPVVPTYKDTLPNMVHSVLQQAVRQSLSVWIVSTVLFGTAQVIAIPSPGVIDGPRKDGRWDIDKQVILQASVSLCEGIHHPWTGLRVEPVFYPNDDSPTMDDVHIGTEKRWMGLQAIQQANACLGCVVLEDSQFLMTDFTDNLAVRAMLSSPISQAMLGAVSWEHDSVHRFLPTTQELNMFRGELAAQCPTLANYATDSLRREYFHRRRDSWVVARAKAGEHRDAGWLSDFKARVGDAWVEAWVSTEEVGASLRGQCSGVKRTASIDGTDPSVKKVKVSKEVVDM